MLIIAIGIAGITVMALANRFGPIPYTKAPSAVGQTRKVTLKVDRTYIEPGGGITLYPDSKRIDFGVVIPGGFTQFFPKNPEFYYKDKKIRVSGLIEAAGSGYRIVVKNQTQVTVLK